MGESVTGLWLRNNQVPYATAAKWGTGINPVHQFYGNPALRTYGRNANAPDVHPPYDAPADFIEPHAPWGYDPADIAGLDVYASDYQAVNGIAFNQDDYPDWGETTPQTRAVIHPDSARPWGSSGGYNNILRSVITAGPWQANNLGPGISYEIPTETVSEGWLNKPASGMHMGTLADAQTSDTSQYEIQTSMTQRYKTQNNDRAVARNTDDAREPISSRTAPMKIKAYSGEQRHYDMFPRQIEQKPRPFWYRNAGTGRITEMAPNEMFVITTVQRTPPPDPSMGVTDSALSENNGGYTAEDQGWY